MKLSVEGVNHFDRELVPDDAFLWTHEITSGDGICSVKEVESNSGKKTLSITAIAPGFLSLAFQWNDNVRSHFAISALARVEKIACRIQSVGDSAGFPIEIRNNGANQLFVECFKGQTLELSATLCFAGENVFQPGMLVKCMNDIVCQTDETYLVQRFNFRKKGTKLFSIEAKDHVAGKSVSISVDVKEEYSIQIRNMMFGGVGLAFLSFLINYGIGFWMFVFYMIPVGLVYWHRKRNYPLYRNLLYWLLSADIFMLVWSAIQEIS